MRSQLGADAVDIDTRESTCSLAFAEPVVLDFRAVESAAADAAYVLTGITLHATGEVVTGLCETCAADVSFLQLAGTGQRLEFAEAQTLGTTDVVADVLGWQTAHPVLKSR